MPITDSAKKALRQSVRRRVRNLTRSNAYKTAMKELKKAVSSGLPAKEIQSLLAKAYKAVDKASKTGVIKKNKASRLKSSAAKLLAPKK